MLKIVESFVAFPQFFKKYINLPARGIVFLVSLKSVFTNGWTHLWSLKFKRSGVFGFRLMLDGGVTWGLWFQFTSSSARIKFSLATPWHKHFILLWLVPPSLWTGIGVLLKGWLTRPIMIRMFAQCEFGVFLQELFCFPFWFYSFVNLLLKLFPKKDLLILPKTRSSFL